jgi:hypothetical protein
MSELRDRVLYVNELLLNFNSERDIAHGERQIGWWLAVQVRSQW